MTSLVIFLLSIINIRLEDCMHSLLHHHFVFEVIARFVGGISFTTFSNIS